MFDAALPEPRPLLQDPAFATALRTCGETPATLPCGLTVLVKRIAGCRIAMLPRAAPPADLARQLADVGLHRLPLLLSPEHACQRPARLRLRAPQTRALLDLTPPEHLRFAALHPKWRNQLRLTQRVNLRVSRAALAPDPCHPLLLAETAQAKTLGYANWPAGLTAAFAKAAPDQTQLFTVKHQGHVIARMLFLTHGAAATYHIGHTTAAGRRHCAHNLLLWEASCWLSRAGFTQLDLGLLHRSTSGLNRFKCRTGAQLKPTGGTWLRWSPLARTPRP